LLIVMMGVGEVWANPISGVLVSHSGATNPISEGWHRGPNGGGVSESPIVDDEGFDAWIIDDNSGGGDLEYQLYPSASEHAAAFSQGWKYTARVKVAEVPDSADRGCFLGYGTDAVRFYIDLGTEADGDPILRLLGPPDMVFVGDGLGPGYHLYEMQYDPATTLATVSVDGIQLTDSYGGYVGGGPDRVLWGSGFNGTGEGRWNMVNFEIIPEPASTALLVCGALGLLVFGFRRRRRTVAAVIVVAVLAVGVGEVWADPISGDVISWHASSGVPPWHSSLPAENRFEIINTSSFVQYHDPEYLEVNDTGNSPNVRVEKHDVPGIHTDDPWACQMEVKVISHQRSREPDYAGSAGITDQGGQGLILFAIDQVGLYKKGTMLPEDWYPMDTTSDFHTYRIVKDSSVVSLFVDTFDAPVLTVQYDELVPSGTSELEMAETSNYGTGNFYIRSYAANVSGTYIPEPGTTALLLCAAITLLGFAWRRRRQAAALVVVGIVFVGVEEVSAESIELIVNGDFELGNTGFSSDYPYTPGTTGAAAQYDLTTDPGKSHPAVNDPSYGDHTTGSGLMMAVNPGSTPGVVVWSQSVGVTPYAPYTFSAWISNWAREGRSPAELDFLFDGTSLGTFQAPATPGVWDEFTATWASQGKTPITVEIIDRNLASNGNDFALDDLSLRLGPGSPAVWADPVELIVNGGFEVPVVAPARYRRLTTGSTAMTGWDVISGNVDVVDESFATGLPYEGEQWVDLNGDVAGAIEQSFATEAGLVYKLSFRYANNAGATETVHGRVTVTGNDTLLEAMLSHADSRRDDMDYRLFSESFIADSSTTTLRFESLTADGRSGIALDRVSLIPEPGSTTLLLCGAFAFLGVALRKRRRSKTSSM